MFVFGRTSRSKSFIKRNPSARFKTTRMSKIAEGNKVAVIGLGMYGVTALKNLLEAGFDAVGLERTEYLGGLWRYSTDPSLTTVIQSTRANISKQSRSYSDFPFPDDVPNYPPAADIAKYIDDYADHFDIRKHCRFGVAVERIERSKDDRHWVVRFKTAKSESEIELFDRILVANGSFTEKYIPKFEGLDGFKGQIVHSQGYKGSQPFASKRVVVVGLSQTAGDTAVDLSGTPAKLYMSFRSGGRIIERPVDGPAMDHKMTRRLNKMGIWLNDWFPKLAAVVGAFALETQMKKRYPYIQKSWGLLPALPIMYVPPVMNDHLMSRFHSGAIEPVAGLKRFLPDGTSLELKDGRILESIDAVVFCTGYHFDYSILAPEANPTTFPSEEWDAAPHNNGLQYSRLYHGLLSTRSPLSLAFSGPWRGHSFAAFSNADLASVAIAETWRGGYKLPPQEEIERWCDQHYATEVKRLYIWRNWKVGQDPRELERWLNEAAGNGLNEKLGWGWEGWKFWLTDFKMYRLIMDGINTPFVYRLFDGRRKKWDGARDAIYKVNGVKTRKRKMEDKAR